MSDIFPLFELVVGFVWNSLDPDVCIGLSLEDRYGCQRCLTLIGGKCFPVHLDMGHTLPMK